MDDARAAVMTGDMNRLWPRAAIASTWSWAIARNE
jgi:hypothetical protein